MLYRLAVLAFLLGVSLSAYAGQDQSSPLRLMMTETAPGTMSSEQYCLLVFSDRTFHAERANRKMGKDRDRKVYQGELSQADWDAMANILDTKDFRDLKVPRSSAPLIIENAHPYTITVAREKGNQNMEFLTNESIKPYEHQVKPLLQWWKSVRGGHLAESKSPPDQRCAPSNNGAVISY